MSSDTTNTTTGTPEDQRTGQPPGGSATGDERKARAAARYAQMTDAEREKINVQFDGRVRDEAYTQAWCEAVDALWESEAGRVRDEAVDALRESEAGRVFPSEQSAEASAPGAASQPAAGGSSTAKDEPLDLNPLLSALMDYVVESIRNGSAQEYVMGLVHETIRDSVRAVLAEEGLDDDAEEDWPPALYTSVVEFARAAQSPSERMMWARFARQLERDGQPGFIERTLTGWMRAKALRVEAVSATLRDLTERAYRLYRDRLDEARERELKERVEQRIESSQNLALILGTFREMMHVAFAQIHLARGAAPEQSASAQTTTGKPPGTGGTPSFS